MSQDLCSNIFGVDGFLRKSEGYSADASRWSASSEIPNRSTMPKADLSGSRKCSSEKKRGRISDREARRQAGRSGHDRSSDSASKEPTAHCSFGRDKLEKHHRFKSKYSKSRKGDEAKERRGERAEPSRFADKDRLLESLFGDCPSNREPRRSDDVDAARESRRSKCSKVPSEPRAPSVGGPREPTADLEKRRKKSDRESGDPRRTRDGDKGREKRREKSPEADENGARTKRRHESRPPPLPPSEGSDASAGEPSPTPSEQPSVDGYDQDYLDALLELQRKIMTSHNRDKLNKLIELVVESAEYVVTDRFFNFDLCALDSPTIKRIRDFFND